MSDQSHIQSGKQFAEMAGDLLDTEVQQAYRIIIDLQRKYAGRSNTTFNLEQMRDETLHRLADIGILATFDPAPCFHGEPPVIEILGKVHTDSIHKHGFDHEQKQYEVKKATARGEDFLGQKERPNARIPKKSKSSE